MTRDDLILYGSWLANQVESGTISPATAQNYVSVVNRVYQLARGDSEIWASPTRDCGIPERNGIAKTSLAMPISTHLEAASRVPQRVFTLMTLQRAFGLRFEESCKLDARRALRTACNARHVTITDGTKGGRSRTIPILCNSQIDILERASLLQNRDRSMIPRTQTYAQFQRYCYRIATFHGIRFHTERHAYAQQRYWDITQVACPVVAAIPHGKQHHIYLANQLGVELTQAKILDMAARQQIALELGHNRQEITNAYLG